MGANHDSRNSQRPPFDPDLVELANRYNDLVVALVDSVSDEQTVQFTKLIGSDDELVQKFAEEETVRYFVIESILPNLEKRYANIIQYCLKLSKENRDALEDVGNMVMYDHLTVQDAEDKDR